MYSVVVVVDVEIGQYMTRKTVQIILQIRNKMHEMIKFPISFALFLV